MAFVPGFENDIFVSYAHVDDQTIHGSDEGWVTTLVETIKTLLAQKLGRDEAFKLWMDYRLLRHVQVTPQILGSLEKTAILLVILSPGYIASDWCRLEMNTFLNMIEERRRSGARVFLIERDRVDDSERPSEFKDLTGYRFWVQDRKGEPPRTLGMPEPQPDDKQYYEELNRLCHDLAKELKCLKEVEDKSISKAFEISNNRPIIYLAEVTDDLDPLRNDVMQYFCQAGLNVLPKNFYPRESNAFQQEMETDLAKCKLFVQILSGVAGKKSPDLPQGYVGLQLQRAKDFKKPILQWHSRDLDTSTIMDSDYRAFLEADTVYVAGIEEFKREVVYRAFLKTIETRRQHVEALVFVNSETSDYELAEEIGKQLDKHGVGYALPVRRGKPAEIRKDLEENLLDCTGLIVVYGITTVIWVRNQLRYYHKIIYKRGSPLKALAVYEGPPELKEPLNFKLPNMHIINCRKGMDATALRSFIEFLQSKEES